MHIIINADQLSNASSTTYYSPSSLPIPCSTVPSSSSSQSAGSATPLQLAEHATVPAEIHPLSSNSSLAVAHQESQMTAGSSLESSVCSNTGFVSKTKLTHQPYYNQSMYPTVAASEQQHMFWANDFHHQKSWIAPQQSPMPSVRVGGPVASNGIKHAQVRVGDQIQKAPVSGSTVKLLTLPSKPKTASSHNKMKSAKSNRSGPSALRADEGPIPTLDSITPATPFFIPEHTPVMVCSSRDGVWRGGYFWRDNTRRVLPSLKESTDSELVFTRSADVALFDAQGKPCDLDALKSKPCFIKVGSIGGSAAQLFWKSGTQSSLGGFSGITVAQIAWELRSRMQSKKQQK